MTDSDPRSMSELDSEERLGFRQADDQNSDKIGQPGPSSFDPADGFRQGGLLGNRYELIRPIDHGAFGRVYLAKDTTLDRDVAVKVYLRPTPNDGAEAATPAKPKEARTLAKLEHPNIPPVYDEGREGECVYIVSKFIEGKNLAEWIREKRVEPKQAADWIAQIAGALACASRHGFIHRDVKPGNILIDKDGKPWLIDFGSARTDRALRFRSERSGTTWLYLSPEQIEGGKIDDRSDIFSLGIVLYELLVRSHPFVSDEELASWWELSPAQRDSLQREVEERIVNDPPKRPRDHDDRIPQTLEQICLKMLAKEPSDRYQSAGCLAEALDRSLGDTDRAAPPRVTYRGLRPFKAQDADFFLELLPGQPDAAGLPESIRFWKTWVENPPQNEKTRGVGLIWGPSGCGKSSLVKAGLLPHLAASVLTVIVEATPNDTERRLERALLTRFPALASVASPWRAVEEISRGRGLAEGTKVLIVLDQFEQWLHVHRQERETDLARALRSCDGEHIQAIIMVRDDFWTAVTRFEEEQLRIHFQKGENTAKVDLFEAQHAQKVLAAFGRALGKLPGQATPAQQEFLKLAVDSQERDDGRLVCVQLALFAEMMKRHEWEPATMGNVDAADVGFQFLQQEFDIRNADFRQRRYRDAAKNVLRTLLPPSEADIRGAMCSREQLLNASGYSSDSDDFDRLLGILDDLRLITPTDPEGLAVERRSLGQADAKGRPTLPPFGGQHYQLTHDCLVRPLRRWLEVEDGRNRQKQDVAQVGDKSSKLRVVLCRNCWIEVMAREDGECPSCRKSLAEVAEGDLGKVPLVVRHLVPLPERCCQCGRETKQTVRIVETVSHKPWTEDTSPLQFAPVLAVRFISWCMNFFLTGSGSRLADEIIVDMPQCDDCSRQYGKPVPIRVNSEELRITFVVCTEFRDFVLAAAQPTSGGTGRAPS